MDLDLKLFDFVRDRKKSLFTPNFKIMLCSESTSFLSHIQVGQSVLFHLNRNGLILSVDFGADSDNDFGNEFSSFIIENTHSEELLPSEYRSMFHEFLRKVHQTGKFISDDLKVSKPGVGAFYKIIITPVPGTTEFHLIVEKTGSEKADLPDQANIALKEFINESPVMLHIVDSKDKIIWVSKHWLKATGYSHDEVLGRSYYDFFTKESRKRSREIERPKLMKEGVNTNIEYQYIHKSGRRMDVLVSAHIERDREGGHKHTFVVVKDITDLKMIKRELLMQKIAIDEAAIVSVTDRIGDITYVNDKFCEVSKYEREELIGQNHRILKSDEHSREFFKDMWKTITKGKVWKGEIKNRAKDGGDYWVQTTIVPFLDENENPDRFMVIRIEISKRKRLEEEIREQNEHLEELIDARTIELRDRTSETLAAFQQLKQKSEDLHKKNRYIIDGINYARRIQKVLLPQKETFKKMFSEAFVLFKPKDLVSGDFYWIEKIGHQVLVASVDCTGHGVPGGFMSMIGSTLLRKIVLNKKIRYPAAILDELHDEVIAALNQNRSDNRDGMDISLCLIDKQKKVLHFAAANQSLYMVNGGKKVIY